MVGSCVVASSDVGSSDVGSSEVGSSLVGSSVVGSSVVGSAVVDASDGRLIPVRLGLAVTERVADGTETVGEPVRLGRPSPEPPPQPVATTRVSAASAARASFVFLTAAPVLSEVKAWSLAWYPRFGLTCCG